MEFKLFASWVEVPLKCNIAHKRLPFVGLLWGRNPKVRLLCGSVELLLGFVIPLHQGIDCDIV